MELLAATKDRFNGIEVDAASLPVDPARFRELLRLSTIAWRQQGLRLIWLQVPIERSGLIPVAVDAGFSFHHSGEAYLMLTLPLDDSAYIPPHATHYIGAGGVVIDSAQRLLVVVERYHRIPGRAPRYKLPGGALNLGEHLVDGVIREVYEETGIRTQFRALVCFRHWHGYRFGKSDIYFVSRLHPLTHTIQRQEEEISECRWMPVEQYLSAEEISPFNRRVVRAALESPGLPTERIEGYGDEHRYEIFMPETAEDAAGSSGEHTSR